MALFEAFLENQRTSRIALARAVADSGFLHGLQQSSPTLFQNVERYARAVGGALGSRDEQIERGLLRYLTRASMKATPFSTFCAILPGKLAWEYRSLEGNEAMSVRGRLEKQLVSCRLNKALYKLLWSHLKARPTASWMLRIDLNPSIQRDDKAWRFITERAGKEMIQRVSISRALEVIVSHVQSSFAPTLRELRDTLLADDKVDASESEVVAFLERLVAIGFLRFQALIPEDLVEWDRPFAAALRTFADPDVQAIGQFLIDLRDKADRYGSEASPRVKAACLDDMRRLIADTLSSLRIDTMLLRDLPVFDDMSADAVVVINCRNAVQSLAEFVRATLPLTNSHIMQANMRRFFDVQYPDRDRVSLLQFYDAYYRIYFRDYLDRQQQVRERDRGSSGQDDLANPYGLPYVAQLLSRRLRLTEVFRAAWQAAPQAEEISIGPDELPSISPASADQVPPHPSESSANLSIRVTRRTRELYLEGVGLLLASENTSLDSYTFFRPM